MEIDNNGFARLRVDLLVPAPDDEIGIRDVRELKAHATALPYLSYLIEEPIEGLVLGKECVAPVKIPRAERFALHKMLVLVRTREPAERIG